MSFMASFRLEAVLFAAKYASICQKNPTYSEADFKASFLGNSVFCLGKILSFTN